MSGASGLLELQQQWTTQLEQYHASQGMRVCWGEGGCRGGKGGTTQSAATRREIYKKRGGVMLGLWVVPVGLGLGVTHHKVGRNDVAGGGGAFVSVGWSRPRGDGRAKGGEGRPGRC